MKQLRSEAGFSLVELLAVVLILAVLSAVAVPLYVNTRKSAAARSCEANISAMAAAESAWALRHGSYTKTVSDLVGATEGFAETPKCPLTGSTDDYEIIDTLNKTGSVTIRCKQDAVHATVITGAATPTPEQKASWNKEMAAPANEGSTSTLVTPVPAAPAQ